MGGLLLILVISGVGYLICSFFSFSFDVEEWNTVSNVIKWMIIAIDGMLLSDIVQDVFGSN